MPRLVMAMYAALALALSTANAQETPLPDPAETAFFYNKPGETAAERDRVELACREFAVQMLPRGEGLTQYGLVGDLITGAARNRYNESFQRQSQEYTDDCMIAQGYRRFHVTAVSAELLQQRLSGAEANTQDQWAGADSPPEGVLARTFTNPNWLPSIGDTPVGETLSVDPPEALAMSFSFGLGVRYSGQNPRDEISLEPNDAALVASLATEGRGTFVLMFIAVDDANRPAVDLGRKAHFRLLGHGGETSVRVFVVPAGRYVISSVGYERLPRMVNRQLCLRTATFTVRPGEMRHLGEFIVEMPNERDPTQFAGIRQGAFQAPRLRINPANLDAARAAITRAPQLASNLAPAVWSNGASFPCYGHSDIGSFDWQAAEAR